MQNAQERLADAIARHRQGRVAEAEALYRQILADHPDLAEAHNALGIALKQMDRNAEALPCFRRALEAKPDYAAAQSNLGAAYQDLGNMADAIACYRAAMALDEESASAWHNLGSALLITGEMDEAAAMFERAVALRPDFAGAQNNRGVACKALGRAAEAAGAFVRAVEADPANPMQRYNLAHALLLTGDFERGWVEHEARFDAGIAQLRHATHPRWMSGDPAGKTILVWAEQGLGDTIQFSRYLPLLAQRGARVLLEVPQALVRLCRSLDGVRVFARGEPLPFYDAQIPLMSLPHQFGTTLSDIPATLPYLRAEQDLVADWGRRLGPAERPRIGLVWAGSPTHKDDVNRSIAPQRLVPLLARSGVEWLSLQYGHEVTRLPLGTTDLAAGLRDFADTAAVICHLDLVIAVDTAVLHLAAALGRPAWGLLPFAPDWRWLLDRDDSPWYPGLRLFRQDHRGDWDGVVQRLGEDLDAWMANGG